MKRLLLSIFLILVLCIPVSSQQQAQLPQVPDQQIESLQYDFRGQWLPSADPAQIGAENYRVLTNLRYTPTGTLESVAGYTKINTTVLTAAPEVDAGFHFKKDNPSESHVLVNADGVIYQNTTAIPSAGDFSATALHTDASGAGVPRFSKAPYGHVAYTNGVETMLWAGDEMPVAAFITSTAAVVNTVTNPKDYTEAVNNSLTTGENIAAGGGLDSYAKLLMHLDGANGGTTFTDSVGTHTPVGGGGNENTDTSQAKFGVSSLKLDGTGDYVTVPDHADWYMGTGTFTIDFWVRFNSLPDTTQTIFQQCFNANNWVKFAATKVGAVHNLVFTVVEAEATTVNIDVEWGTPDVNVWYHVAVIRGWGGVANQWGITGDGILRGAYITDASAWPDLAAAFTIGVNATGGGGADLNGWIDEFRVTKGIARWEANFTPPAKAYSAAANIFLLGSPRPLQGFKVYIGDPNLIASTMTVKEWQGNSWVTLTAAANSWVDNTDTGASLAVTGTVTWTDTGQARVKHIEGQLLYWYQVSIDAGSATIYRVSLNASWQNIVDIWDGAYRQPIQFQAYKAAKYEDYTLEVNEPDATYYGDLGGLTAAEHLILMFDDRATAIKWVMVAGKENVTAATVTIYYWDGGAWVSVGTVADTTLDTAGSTKSLGQSGVMSWDAPRREQEFFQTLFGKTGFAYKLVWSATLTASNAQVNIVTGIPAQLKMNPFKFPAEYRDRLLLCGYTEGGQGNRCDYSMAHAPQVFNGAETSNGGTQSLYFGGEEELTAGAQLYNRMGSNIFIFFIALKDSETYVLNGDGPDTFAIYPVSLNVGCPAPATLITAEMGFDLAADVQRHIAAWVSYSGPVIFDGAVIYKIPGLEVYFDPNSPDYLGQTVIKATIGWFDQSYGEYNIIAGTHWFAYNLRLKRWFEKHTGVAETPISAWPVRDTSGNEYVYAGLDNGFAVRLEYGTSWNNTGINQKVQTGDFWPSKNVWDLTRIRRVKLVAKRIAESHSLRIVHFGDGAEIAITDWSWDNSTSFEWTNSSFWVWDNGNYVTFVDLSGGTTKNRPRIISATQPTNLLNWLHGLRFEVSTTSSTKGFQPIGWAIEYLKERKDY